MWVAMGVRQPAPVYGGQVAARKGGRATFATGARVLTLTLARATPAPAPLPLAPERGGVGTRKVSR